MSIKETISNHRITVKLLGSGFAAIMLVEVTDEKLGTYTDIQQTGIGRYKTKQEAESEAKHWANDEGIPYIT